MFDVGWFTAPAGLLRSGEDMDEPFRYPVPAYLIETDAERILVDTGLHPERLEAVGPFQLEQELSVADQVDVATLTRVVLTHLHFDHVAALALVPASVPVVVQRSEWAAGHDKAAVARNFYLPRDYALSERKIELVDGDHDLLGDGSILLLLTPGHTPGHQSVQAGDLVIGADVVHFASGLEDHRFPAFGDHRDAQARSAERLRALRDAGHTVLPGHDPDVLRPGPVSTRRDGVP
jgi:glyoxylase-like metal-dependent hydrolase (beta-lactamase superfamily II)